MPMECQCIGGVGSVSDYGFTFGAIVSDYGFTFGAIVSEYGSKMSKMSTILARRINHRIIGIKGVNSIGSRG